MNVVRFGFERSTVHVSWQGEQLACVSCSLGSGAAPHFYADTPEAMIEHLREHELAGGIVPSWVYDEIAKRG